MNTALTVLLVDDVSDLRILSRLALRNTEFQVVAEAADGLQAIEAARRCQPDVVLLDLSMPVMDGLEALPRIRGVAPESRVVILSGFQTDRMVSVARSLGALAYIEKGLSPKQFLDALRGAVATADARDRAAFEPPAAPAPRTFPRAIRHTAPNSGGPIDAHIAATGSPF